MVQIPNSQSMKLAAPTAMPTPKMIPASIRFEPPPSSNAKAMPPTTIATRLSPRAMGPVIVITKALTAASHGDTAARAGDGQTSAVRMTTQAATTFFETGARPDAGLGMGRSFQASTRDYDHAHEHTQFTNWKASASVSRSLAQRADLLGLTDALAGPGEAAHGQLRRMRRRF